ncbi:MAG: hypothetical protein IMY70_01835 [Bacteroidetes bacterium]|nr:hypothetical protein [Bacteroidota bacterium]
MRNLSLILKLKGGEKMKLKILAIIIALSVMFVSCGKDNDDDNNGPTWPGNTAPVLTEIAYQTVNAGATENVELSATDADGDSLNFSILTSPGFISITGFSQVGDTATATLVIAPEDSISGNFPGTIRVSDNRGGADSASFAIEVQQLPEIVWGYPGVYVSVTYRYYGGVLCGYTAMPRFRNTGGSGTVEFQATTTSGSELAEQFNVAGGEQYYGLIIKGGLTAGGWWQEQTLIVGSPSANTTWETTIDEVSSMTISSMEMELIP